MAAGGSAPLWRWVWCAGSSGRAIRTRRPVTGGLWAISAGRAAEALPFRTCFEKLLHLPLLSVLGPAGAAVAVRVLVMAGEAADLLDFAFDDSHHPMVHEEAAAGAVIVDDVAESGLAVRHGSVIPAGRSRDFLILQETVGLLGGGGNPSRFRPRIMPVFEPEHVGTARHGAVPGSGDFRARMAFSLYARHPVPGGAALLMDSSNRRRVSVRGCEIIGSVPAACQ